MMISIKDLQPGDTGWLVACHRSHYAQSDGFDDSFGRLVAEILADFEANHVPSRERAFIAWRGEKRLGSVFCVAQDATTAKLRLFFLVPEARGLGLGQRLLDDLTHFARQVGYEKLVLWTHESHQAACALYRKNGWIMRSAQAKHSFGARVIEQHWEKCLLPPLQK